MRRKIWIRRGNLVAKAVWVKEAASGLYVGPSVGPASVHFSYHQDGRRHLTTAPRSHHVNRQSEDSALLDVTEQRNVGGFGIEPSELRWEPVSPRGKKDLVIDCGPDVNLHLPLLVSLHVCTGAHFANFRERIRSAGPTHKDECVCFELKAFKHLKGVIHVQYNTPA